MDPLVPDPTEAGYDTPELEGFNFAQFVNPTRGPSITPNRPSLSVPGPRGGGQANQWQQLGPLLAILPAILKGQGTAGVAAFLQGMQQARQQKQQHAAQQGQLAFQNQRLTEADARAQEAQDALASYRQDTLGQQQKDRSAKFTMDIAAKLSVAETPEQIDGIKQWATMAAPFFGVEPRAIEAVAAKAAPTSSTLIERQVKKVLESKDKDEINQLLAGRLSLTVPGQQMPIKFDDWSQYVSRMIDPKTGQTVLRAKKPVDDPLDRQALGALRAEFTAKNGREPNPTELKALIVEAKKITGQADDRPRMGATDYQTFNMSERLAKAWTTANAPVKEMDRQLRVMQTGLRRFRQGDENGGSQAVLVTFQKILDPTSVVRESEYARTRDGQAFLARIQGYAERLAKGGAGMTDAELAAMVGTGAQMFADMAAWQTGTRRRIAAQAQRYGIDPALVFDDAVLGGGETATPAVGGGAGGVTKQNNPYAR